MPVTSVFLRIFGRNYAKLEQVKSRIWFYEFNLPDGSRTSTDVPADVRPIHTSRRDKLVQMIRERVESPQDLTAIDLASHEGYYSIELSRHFKSVRGYEFREESLAAARLKTPARLRSGPPRGLCR
jgi:tRNA (mo5U34)-methyltransferase